MDLSVFLMDNILQKEKINIIELETLKSKNKSSWILSL